MYYYVDYVVLRCQTFGIRDTVCVGCDDRTYGEIYGDNYKG